MTPSLQPEIPSPRALLSISRDYSTISSPFLPHPWSAYERDQFLTKLHYVMTACPSLDPTFAEKNFELISQELAGEEINKTPQECQEFYEKLVQRGSIAETMEMNRKMARLFNHHLTEIINKDASDHQELEESQEENQVDALREQRDIKVDPNLQDKDKKKSTRPYRRLYLWSAEEEQCLYREYKAHFKNNKTDNRLAKERWESIACNVEAQGFPRRSREPYITRWAMKRDYFGYNVKKEFDWEQEEGGDSPDISLTEAQRDELEVSYKVNEHLDNEEEVSLAERVGLPINEVKKWFQMKGAMVVNSTSLLHSKRVQEKGNAGLINGLIGPTLFHQSLFLEKRK